MKTKNLFQILALLTLLMGLLPPQTTTYAASESNELSASALSTTLAIPYISEFSGAPTQNYDCGPATAGMIVQAFGKRPANISDATFIGEIRKKMNKTGAVGTGSNDRKVALAAYGIGSTVIKSSNPDPVQTIRDALAQGKPVIARVNGTKLGRRYAGHVVVVTGFSADGQTIYVNDPDSTIKGTSTPGGVAAWPVDIFRTAMLNVTELASEGYGLLINDGLVTYGGVWVAQSAYPTVAQGQSIDLSAIFQNTGNTPWSNTGANPTRIGTTNPTNNAIDFISPFACPSWVSNGRPANLTESSVAPGSNGTFNFPICIPADTVPGTYHIAVAPLVEGITWMLQPGVTVYWEITVKAAEVTCPATFSGWKGEYYNSRDFSGPMVLCRDEADVNFTWNRGSPDPAVSRDNFTARFSRTLDLPAGDYTFHLAGDDGIRLIVDGQTLIDKWIDQVVTEYTTQVHLEAGSHNIQVDYYESISGAIVKLWWDASVQPANLSASVSAAPSSIKVGETTKVFLSLNNIPAESLSAVEFACQVDPSLGEVSALSESGLFGPDAVFAPNGPTNGDFILPIAASNENRAAASGEAAQFTVKALQPGELTINCAVKVSSGNNELTDIPFTPTKLKAIAVPPTAPPVTVTPPPVTVTPPPVTVTPPVTETPSIVEGTLNGSVIASKPVTIRLLNADGSEADNIPAESNGSFSSNLLAGSYTIIASADGFLSVQGSVIITAGQPSAMPQSNLLAGDINADGKIDAFDLVSIGANYGKSAPSAADLNNDGKLDVLDLQLLARNYRKSGPINWQ